MFTVIFWKAAFERAIKTLGQVLLALFLNGQANVLTVDWTSALAVAATAVVVSFLTSIVSAQVSPTGSPSLVVDTPAAKQEDKPVEPEPEVVPEPSPEVPVAAPRKRAPRKKVE